MTEKKTTRSHGSGLSLTSEMEKWLQQKPSTVRHRAAQCVAIHRHVLSSGVSLLVYKEQNIWLIMGTGHLTYVCRCECAPETNSC